MPNAMERKQVSTLPELLALLPHDGWQVTIRGRIRHCGWCPIEKAAGGLPLGLADTRLDMDLKLREHVITAADYRVSTLAPDLAAMRQALLQYFGLEERANA